MAKLTIIGCLLFMLAGCVNRQLTESYGAFLETAGQEYLEYVESDPALSDEDREIRQINCNEAAKTVEKFKTTKWSW